MDELKYSDFENSDKFKDIKEKEFLEAIFHGILQHAKNEGISIDRFIILIELMYIRIRDAYKRIKKEN